MQFWSWDLLLLMVLNTAEQVIDIILAVLLSSIPMLGLAAGIEIDAFAPRLSFFWGIGMNFYMVCKL